ncbi:MAG: iron ABC transporter permease [Pseudobacteriovorax sp.]|nr:iron ABC transporter permease [Pseudobacteriovorax sp.]
MLLCSVALIFNLTAGAYNMDSFQVISAVWDFITLSSNTTTESVIVSQVRLPRVILGLLVGAVLAGSGAITQAIFRNPLASPGLIGVQSGALLGALIAIVLGNSVASRLGGFDSSLLTPLGAFISGVATTILVFKLSRHKGQTMLMTLLLAGVAISAIIGAFTGLLMYVADDEQLRTLTFWTLGSLGGASWTTLSYSAPILLLCIGVIPFLSNHLNALTLGESQAAHLGVAVEQTKLLSIVIVALGVGTAVSATGMIGFIGLVAPHLIRLICGPDHRALLVLTMLLGASLLNLADAFSKIIVEPSELPIGILTSFIGGPFFLWLLIKQKGKMTL